MCVGVYGITWHCCSPVLPPAHTRSHSRKRRHKTNIRQGSNTQGERHHAPPPSSCRGREAKENAKTKSLFLAYFYTSRADRTKAQAHPHRWQGAGRVCYRHRNCSTRDYHNIRKCSYRSRNCYRHSRPTKPSSNKSKSFLPGCSLPVPGPHPGTGECHDRDGNAHSKCY